jgi:hypothetical protein
LPHFTLTLSSSGPLCDAYIAVSEGRAIALTAANQNLPAPVKVRALIDTGASCTGVDPSVLAALQLTPTGSTPVNTPSTGTNPHVVDEYDVGFVIPPAKAGQIPFVLKTIGVVSVQLLQAQGIHVLIGRDVLEHCILIYNGQAGTFSISF